MATKRARSSGFRTTGKPSVPFGLGCAVTISDRAARTMPRSAAICSISVPVIPGMS